VRSFWFVWAWLCVGCGIQVDHGPFPIKADQGLISSKTRYLDSIGKIPLGAMVPNIVLIVADDLGKHDISTYDPNGVEVPAIDRIARRGMRFDQAYSTSSVCSPSRVGMLTGRYQQRFGFERQPMNRYARNRVEYWVVDHLMRTDPMQPITPMAKPDQEEIALQGIPAGEILLSEILVSRGYSTGIFGKWHLGHEEPFLPNNRGFQQQFGFYEAFTRYVPPGTRGMAEYRHNYFASKHIWRQKRKGICAIRENDHEIEDKEYLTFSIAGRACRFMKEHRDDPFFLYVPFSAPHTPFQVPQEYADRFEEEPDLNKRIYKGMIAALDDAVGMITEKIEALGLEENTVVIFVSDNGGATYTGATDNGPLKAGKFSQFEGGINIPMLISWPGQLSSGQVYTEPVSLMDIFTTCVSLSGSPLPEDRKIDGMDLSVLISDEDPMVSRRPLYWRTDFNRAVRYGNHKMVWNQRDGQVFLYDLAADPGEQENLAGRKPELVEEIMDRYRMWESEMKSPLWPGVMEFVFNIEGETTRWAI